MEKEMWAVPEPVLQYSGTFTVLSEHGTTNHLRTMVSVAAVIFGLT